MKLTIELVPETAWFSNVRSEVSKSTWDRIRRKCYKEAGYVCEICGGKGPKHPVECHEIWEYNDDTYKQILKGLISLCPNCHKVKHPGLAQIKGETDIVINQLMKVNNIPKTKAINYINESFNVWEERSKHEWECDISYLDEYLN